MAKRIKAPTGDCTADHWRMLHSASGKELWTTPFADWHEIGISVNGETVMTVTIDADVEDHHEAVCAAVDWARDHL